jgi:hypothetical protein
VSGTVVVNQPGVFLVDADGNTVTLNDVGTIGAAEGIVIMGKDGTVARMMVVDSTGKLAIQNPPNMDVALSTLATETKLEAVRVLLAAIDADTSTLAAVDYATQTTLATLATEAKLEAVRVLLASLDAKDYATQTTLATLATETKLEAVRVLLASLDGKDYATETTQATLATEAKLETVRVLLASLDSKDYATQTTLAAILVDTGQIEALITTLTGVDYATQTTLAAVLVDTGQIETLLTSIKSTDGIKKITDQLPAGTNEIGKVAQGTKSALVDAWPTVVTDAAGNAISSQDDAGVRRLEISGKVSVTGASPPPSTLPALIYADTPLVVGTHDTIFVIPDGETYFLQELVSGNEDPTKGAVVEVLYDNGTEHLVARQYISGQTISINEPEDGLARDGTTCVGNVGGTFTIIVRRTKYSGSDIAIDAEARGYTA